MVSWNNQMWKNYTITIMLYRYIQYNDVAPDLSFDVCNQTQLPIFYEKLESPTGKSCLDKRLKKFQHG